MLASEIPVFQAFHQQYAQTRPTVCGGLDVCTASHATFSIKNNTCIQKPTLSGFIFVINPNELAWIVFCRNAWLGSLSLHFTHTYIHIYIYIYIGVPESEFFECAFGPFLSTLFPSFFPLFPFRPCSLSHHFSPLHLPFTPFLDS